MLLTLPCAFSAVKISKVNGFVGTECTAEKKNSLVLFFFLFHFFVPLLDTCKGDAFEARLF